MNRSTYSVSLPEKHVRAVVALVALHGLLRSTEYRFRGLEVIDRAFDLADSFVESLGYYEQTSDREQEGDA